MAEATDLSQQICGAKLRKGPCRALPVAGKSRCHAHGGAPRSGAPLGNLNALKHGGYVGGRSHLDRRARSRLRKMSAAERDCIPRLERDARLIESGAPLPPNPASALLAKKWRGQKVRKMLLRQKKPFEKVILDAAKYGHVQLDGDWPARDVLYCLCQETSWFETIEAFAEAVCRVFLYLDNGTREVPRWGTPDAKIYYLGWRSFCAELYDWCRPDVAAGWARKKRRPTDVAIESGSRKSPDLGRQLEAHAMG